MAKASAKQRFPERNWGTNRPTKSRGQGEGEILAALGTQSQLVYIPGDGRCRTATDGAGKKPAVDLGVLEEDDEFEEFPAEDWTGLDEDEDTHVWEDNWDDDNLEEYFSNQLRAELEKHGHKMETS
uniref:26S proteasome complex subunit SEM1 n=1 Tax=Petromyzon marinus TaxID=7757 RepID=A0AAJ7UAM8_PETMA|nr:LOW QUALITY PROTEIN: 26S proteasome complex subunit SEM1 [Petromyzon marinus]